MDATKASISTAAARYSLILTASTCGGRTETRFIYRERQAERIDQHHRERTAPVSVRFLSGGTDVSDSTVVQLKLAEVRKAAVPLLFENQHLEESACELKFFVFVVVLLLFFYA